MSSLRKKILSAKGGYVDIEGNIIPSNKVVEENGFRCIKSLFGYTCFDKSGKKHKLKYQPIYEYDRYLICFNSVNLYAYDKELQTYQLLSNEFSKSDNIDFGKNTLSYKDKFYFIGDQIIDLGSAGYSSDKVLSIEKDNNFPVLLFEQFSKEYQADPNLRKKLQEKISLLEKKNLEDKLKYEQAKKEEAEEQLSRDLKDKVNELSSITSEIEQLQSELSQTQRFESFNKTKPVGEEFLFDYVNDHKEFKEGLKKQSLLQYLDLSLISFDNVKVSGIDLSYTNAQIDPQKVYNKDMSNGNYSGVSFISKDFSGVDIRNSNFSECNLDFALFNGAIKDGSTTISNSSNKTI